MELRSGNSDEGNILFVEDGRNSGIRFVSGTMVRHAFPAHLHRSACFGVIAGGEAILKINGEERLLRAGDRYAIPAMRSHALRPIGGGWFSHRVFGADPDRRWETARMLRESLGAELSAEWPDGFADAERAPSDIPADFREILAAFESEPEPARALKADCENDPETGVGTADEPPVASPPPAAPSSAATTSGQ